jgi:hypothetical protein
MRRAHWHLFVVGPTSEPSLGAGSFGGFAPVVVAVGEAARVPPSLRGGYRALIDGESEIYAQRVVHLSDSSMGARPSGVLT